MVDLTERLQVLLRQEREHYGCADYLSSVVQEQLARDAPQPDVTSLSSSASSSASSTSSAGINELWREKICEWSYQVADHFDFSREVVAISMSFLDRYLSTTQVNKKLFQLAAMTTLYLAIKLYEPGTLSMASMIDLSRGYFMVEQMAAMEMAILRALSWRVHPPTPCCMSRHLLHLMPQTSCPPHVRHDILELARFLTELSVCDYFFAPKKASNIALAALLNAMEALQAGITFPALYGFFEQLQVRVGLDANDPEVEECRIRLQELYTQGGYGASAPEEAPEEPKMDDGRKTVSPVCVGAMHP